MAFVHRIDRVDWFGGYTRVLGTPGTLATGNGSLEMGAESPADFIDGLEMFRGLRFKKTQEKVMNSTMPSLTANHRVPQGKSAARRLRAAGQIPAVAYGKGLPSTSLAVSPKEIVHVLKSEHGQNSVIHLKVEGDGGGAGAPSVMTVMIRDFSYHPVTRSLEHVDFVQVKLDQPVDAMVPFLTHGKPAGVVLGGVLRQVYRTLPVRCLPDRIPVKIEIDVTELNLSEHLATKDLKLPEGVSVMLPPDQTLVSIVAPEKDRSEEGAGGAPGAAAKTAAAGKDAKAGAAAKDAKKK